MEYAQNCGEDSVARLLRVCWCSEGGSGIEVMQKKSAEQTNNFGRSIGVGGAFKIFLVLKLESASGCSLVGQRLNMMHILGLFQLQATLLCSEGQAEDPTNERDVALGEEDVSDVINLGSV